LNALIRMQVSPHQIFGGGYLAEPKRIGRFVQGNRHDRSGGEIPAFLLAHSMKPKNDEYS